MAKKVIMADKIKNARWAFDCLTWKPTYANLSLASCSIQEEEKERINRFVFQRDAKRSLIGRLLMRKFVLDCSNIPWNEIKLIRDENGKPYLSAVLTSMPCFNVSHSGQFAVLAGEVGDVKIGVDVMKMEYTGGKKISAFFRIMTRHFSSNEWSIIRGCSTEEKVQLNMFYRFWSLKESYVKATGTGITVELQNISFKINSELEKDKFVEDTELYLEGEKQNQWLFQETLLNEDHCVAVALYGEDISKFKGHCDKFAFLNFDDVTVGSKCVSPEDANFCMQFLAKE